MVHQSILFKRLAITLGLLLLPLLLATPMLSAQTEAPATDESDKAAQEAADAEEISIDADAAPPLPSPDDYQASEQISEDLSVSFPVDI